MSKWKNYIPEGTKDTLFSEYTTKNNLKNSIREVFIKHGYLEVQTPTLEFYDVFDFNNQPINQENMYKFFDNKGRILALRPDYTVPIARVFSNKIKEFPIKLCYGGQIYRQNLSHYGMNNEITQAGIEIIGVSNYRAEVQLILTAIEALKAAGIDDFKIEIGQSEFYKSIIEELSLSKCELEELKILIENKNFGTLLTFLKGKSDKLSEKEISLLKLLPQLFGGIEILDKVEEYTENKKAIEALNNVRDIYFALHTIGYSKYLSIDLGMIPNINYYTGIIFKGYLNEIGEEILSGGRYDKLMGEFGENIPSAGLGINVDNLLRVIKERGKLLTDDSPEFAIHFHDKCFKEALEYMNSLREQNKSCELSLSENLEEAKRYCIKRKIDNLVSINLDGINIYGVKDDNNHIEKRLGL